MLIDYLSADAYTYVLAIACIVVGFSIATIGYRYRRAALFTTALFAAGDYVLQVLHAMDIFFNSATAYYLTFFGVGLLFGAVALAHTKSGVVITGFCTGVLLTILILYMADFDGENRIMCLFYSIGGLVVAPLTFFTKKHGLVAAMSFVGASMFTNGVQFFVYKDISRDYFNYRMSSSMDSQSESMNAANEYYDKLESTWWTLTAIQLALTVVAVAVQLLLTARNVDHDILQDEAELPVAGTTQYTKVQTPQPNGKFTSTGNPVSLV